MKKNAYVCAVDLLVRREHSRRELFEKLTQRCPEEHSEIDAVLDRLIAEGYLSDTRFAEAYARSRSNRGFGQRRILMELKQKGVDAEIAETALDEVMVRGEDFSESNVYRSWYKKFKSNPRDLKDKQRQTRYLLYRGFDMEEVNELFSFLSHQVEQDE